LYGLDTILETLIFKGTLLLSLIIFSGNRFDLLFYVERAELADVLVLAD
jgi:hypothetical protein